MSQPYALHAHADQSYVATSTAAPHAVPARHDAAYASTAVAEADVVVEHRPPPFVVGSNQAPAYVERSVAPPHSAATVDANSSFFERKPNAEPYGRGSE